MTVSVGGAAMSPVVVAQWIAPSAICRTSGETPSRSAAAMSIALVSVGVTTGRVTTDACAGAASSDDASRPSHGNATRHTIAVDTNRKGAALQIR